jgi:hypothetical protein
MGLKEIAHKKGERGRIVTRFGLIAVLLVAMLGGGVFAASQLGRGEVSASQAPSVSRSVIPTVVPEVVPTTAPPLTLVQTASPQPIPTIAPTPQVVTLSGSITAAGKQIRAGVNLYRMAPDFCLAFAAAINGRTQFPSSAVLTTAGQSGSYVLTAIPGTYVLVVSPREAPGGNWFWNMTTDCTKAEPITLTQNASLNLAIP